MPTCNLILTFHKAGLAFDDSQLSGHSERQQSSQLFTALWTQLRGQTTPCWSTLWELTLGLTDLIEEHATVEGDQIRMVILAGSQGFNIAEQLVCVLHGAGYRDICLQLFTDECDYIEDDETGELYPVSSLFTVGAEGEVIETDYPTVEYSEYD